MVDVKTFYKTQGEVAEIIIKLIDSYWGDEIKEPEFIELIQKIKQNNDHLIYKNGDFTTILKQKCGKRRLEVVARILKLSIKAD